MLIPLEFKRRQNSNNSWPVRIPSPNFCNLMIVLRCKLSISLARHCHPPL